MSEGRSCRAHRETTNWSSLVRFHLTMKVLLSLERQLISVTLATGLGRSKESLQEVIPLLFTRALLSYRNLLFVRVVRFHCHTFRGLPHSLVNPRFSCISVFMKGVALFISECELAMLDNFLLPEFLLVIVVFEVIIESGGRSEVLDDCQHSFTGFGVDLLAVPSLTGWLVLVERILDMDELSIWNIFDVGPLNFDRAWPLSWLLPQLLMSGFVVDSLDHFGDSTEMLGLVHTK